MEYKGMERLLKVIIGTNKPEKVFQNVKSFYVPVKLKTNNVYNIIKIK